MTLWWWVTGIAILGVIGLAVALALGERANREARHEADWEVLEKSANEMTPTEINRVVRDLSKRR